MGEEGRRGTHSVSGTAMDCVDAGPAAAISAAWRGTRDRGTSLPVSPAATTNQAWLVPCELVLTRTVRHHKTAGDGPLTSVSQDEKRSVHVVVLCEEDTAAQYPTSRAKLSVCVCVSFADTTADITVRKVGMLTRVLT